VSLVDPDESEAALDGWARELGVDREVMQRLVEQRRALVYDVAADPRGWGFDLLQPGARRRDVATEFRQQTRLTGTLADSFLQGHAPLLALVPDPPTLPSGRPLDEHLVERARLDPDVARDVAQHVRTTIQAGLGRALVAEDFAHAVREAAWDHDVDAAQVGSVVERAVADLLR
jgi:hypothetical protein